MKHLSAAMSYGKEVMSGHGQGAELDHRPDFLGELINAEHHMEFLDNVLFRAITDFRRSLQEEGLNLKPEHIDRLRQKPKIKKGAARAVQRRKTKKFPNGKKNKDCLTGFLMWSFRCGAKIQGVTGRNCAMHCVQSSAIWLDTVM
jgi:hypothetical protein